MNNGLNDETHGENLSERIIQELEKVEEVIARWEHSAGIEAVKSLPTSEKLRRLLAGVGTHYIQKAKVLEVQLGQCKEMDKEQSVLWTKRMQVLVGALEDAKKKHQQLLNCLDLWIKACDDNISTSERLCRTEIAAKMTMDAGLRLPSADSKSS